MTKRTLGQLRTQIHTGLLMNNDLGLGGRRALVTGGTKGIGAAVAAPEEPVKQGSSAIKRRFFTSTWSGHLRVGLLTISLLMYGFPMSGASAEDTVRLESAYSFLDTLARLRFALQGKASRSSQPSTIAPAPCLLGSICHRLRCSLWQSKGR